MQNYFPEEIDSWFTYHAPKGDQTDRYGKIRTSAKDFATLIGQLVPDGPEREWAWARLREVTMWSNAGIACGEMDTEADAPMAPDASDDPFILDLYNKNFPAFDALMKQQQGPVRESPANPR